ncbi:MAG: hypothetical protein DRO88_07590 [Promethearchaeia archaeon]|nr:MAG: hypothetical protein DRO88_07590 [Candidatus Lokiarchaeia archaeon]
MVCVIHKHSNQIIFFQRNESHPIQVDLLEKTQNFIQTDRRIQNRPIFSLESVQLNNLHNLIWVGNYTYVVLLIHQKPSPMEREMLQTFSVRLESRFASELQGLYSTYLGNIDIFLQDLPTRQNLKKMAEETFNIKYTKPYYFREVDMPPSGLAGEIIKYIQLQIENQGFVYIPHILTHFDAIYPFQKLKIQELVYKLIKSGNLYLN